MKLIYPAIFHEDNDGIWVDFPDLQGCQSYGESIGEALDGAKEALEGYCIALLEEKHNIPAPSDIKSIKIKKGTFVSLVETDITTRLSKQKSVRKTLTIPSWMNDMAIERGINFSAVLQEALSSRLNIQ